MAQDKNGAKAFGTLREGVLERISVGQRQAEEIRDLREKLARAEDARRKLELETRTQLGLAIAALNGCLPGLPPDGGAALKAREVVVGLQEFLKELPR